MYPVALDRTDVIAYRLATQHLHRRLPTSAIARAAVCGLQDSAPRSAVLALRDAFAILGERMDRLVQAGTTGRVRLRWDGRDTLVSMVTAPHTDPESARAELLRRFLGALGPPRRTVSGGGPAWVSRRLARPGKP